MSSRALRKLRREAEEQKQAVAQQSDPDSESGLVEPQAKPKFGKINAFDFLNEAQADSGSEEEEDNVPSVGKPDPKIGGDNAHEDQVSQSDDATAPSQQAGKKARKKSKKKKKRVAKHTDDNIPTAPNNTMGKEGADLDEIDLALQALKTSSKGKHYDTELPQASDDLLRFYKLLATDSKQLNALNEMKKLFGDVVMDEEGAGQAANARPGRRQRQQLDLGAALNGTNSPASRGKSLKALALRRNIFIQGKETWPNGSSGGLGMEVVEKASDFTTEYRFVHSSVYQETQRQFNMCVESMDPQRIIYHLQNNRKYPDLTQIRVAHTIPSISHLESFAGFRNCQAPG